MEVMFVLAVVYSILSYFIGIFDLLRLKSKKKDLAQVSTQDLKEFLGIRNYIFLPSAFIILVITGVIKLIKGVFN